MDLARLEDVFAEPGCLFSALGPILASCAVPENTDERTRIAVKLAVCEFRAASVDFPPQCASEILSSDVLAVCTRLLETKSTWWTTFSNNFHHISSVCSEFRPEYAQRNEAERVVGIYRNATELFSDYQALVSDTLTSMQANWVEFESKLEEISVGHARTVHLAQAALSELQHEAATTLEQFSSLNRIALAADAALDNARSSALALSLQHNRMSAIVNEVVHGMSEMRSSQYEATAEIESITLKLATETNKLRGALDGMSGIFGLFTLIRGIIRWSIIVAFIPVGLVLWRNARGPTCDPIFY